MDRIPPNSLESERAILGAMLIDADAIRSAAEHIRPADFYAHTHGDIAKVIFDLDHDGKPVNKFSVMDELRDRKIIDRVGGPSYITALISDGLEVATGAEYFAKVVAEKSQLRRLIAAGKQIYKLGFEGEADAQAAIAHSESILREALLGNASLDTGVSIADGLRGVLADIDNAANGLSGAQLTPWPTVNRVTGGFRGGELVVWAGAPGMGKSAATMQLAQFVARHHGLVANFALEMGVNATVRRMMASAADVPMQAMRAGTIQPQQYDRIGQTVSRIAELPLVLFGGYPRKSVHDIRRTCRRLSPEGLKAVVIDHPGFLSEAHSGAKGVSKHERFEAVYQELLLIGGEFDVVMHVVQHLNREGMEGAPTLKHLRDGGNLEGAAHIVIFPYRPNIINSPRNGEFRLAKIRDGEPCVVPFEYDGPHFEWNEQTHALGGVA